MCGDAVNPCKLHIELQVGKKHHIDEIIDITEDIINDTKEDIIKLKMDLTYNYKTQEEIIDDFNVLKKDILSYRRKWNH